MGERPGGGAEDARPARGACFEVCFFFGCRNEPVDAARGKKEDERGGGGGGGGGGDGVKGGVEGGGGGRTFTGGGGEMLMSTS